jgi:hypothetical protein
MHRRRAVLLHATSAVACLAGFVYGCSSDDAPPTPATDAGQDVTDAGTLDTGKDTGIAPDASGCGTAPGLGSNPESKCAGKIGQKTPDGTGKEPGEACTSEADCIPFCAACADGGFVSSVAICRCGKCGTAAETSEAFQKANFPCNSQ